MGALCALAPNKDVYVKVFAFYSLGQKRPPQDDLLPRVRRLHDAYGPERLMWASDCPFRVLRETYEDSVSHLHDRLEDLDKDARDQVLRGTAERKYFFR